MVAASTIVRTADTVFVYPLRTMYDRAICTCSCMLRITRVYCAAAAVVRPARKRALPTSFASNQCAYHWFPSRLPSGDGCGGTAAMHWCVPKASVVHRASRKHNPLVSAKTVVRFGHECTLV
eukprot:9446025-Pyramimonas_sp.AAC.1